MWSCEKLWEQVHHKIEGGSMSARMREMNKEAVNADEERITARQEISNQFILRLSDAGKKCSANLSTPSILRLRHPLLPGT